MIYDVPQTDTIPPLSPSVIEKIKQEKPIPLSVYKIIKGAGYDNAKFIGLWNGFEVYQPIYSNSEIHYIGYPHRILLKENTIRWTSNREAIEILNTLKK